MVSIKKTYTASITCCLELNIARRDVRKVLNLFNHVTSEGTWDKKLGECSPNNCSTPVITHGYLDQTLGFYPNGSVISLKCDHNYKLNGKCWAESKLSLVSLVVLLLLDNREFLQLNNLLAKILSIHPGKDNITCLLGNWTDIPTCVLTYCDSPSPGPNQLPLSLPTYHVSWAKRTMLEK